MSSKTAVYKGVPVNRLYSAEVVVSEWNTAWLEGLHTGWKEMIELQSTVIALTSLLRELLMLAAYAEPYKFDILILQLAQEEAGASKIESLAGELTKRLDVVATTYERIFRSKLAETDSLVMIQNTLLIRAALLEARNDKGASLRSEPIQAILGTSVKWIPSTPVGRPQGVSPEDLWLAEQIKRYPKGVMWEIGKKIFAEISQKRITELTPEEESAFKKLKRYITINKDGMIYVAQPQQLGNCLNQIVSRARNKS